MPFFYDFLSLFQNRRFWKEASSFFHRKKNKEASYKKARNLFIRFRMPFYSFFFRRKKKERRKKERTRSEEKNLRFF
jgi:hypothetical protein